MIPLIPAMEKEIHKYLTIEKESISELVVDRSRFIAHSFSVTYQEMVREKILQIQSLYPMPATGVTLAPWSQPTT